MADTDALPDDVSQLKALIVGQWAEIADQQAEITPLKPWIAKLRRQQFGRRSDRAGNRLDQLELHLEELEVGAAERGVQQESTQPRSAEPKSRTLPAHLPHEIQLHRPDASVCLDCGGLLKVLGEDVAERLEYVPSHFRVIRQVRPKHACGRCDRIVQAPAPSRPIARGLAGPGLLVHVLVSKCSYHLPLYRQSEIHARARVELPRSTLADRAGEAATSLRPLVAVVRRHVLSTDKVRTGDTPVSVPGKGSTQQGRLWAYVRDDRPCDDPIPPVVWFAYSPDRQGQHPRNHLRDFRSALQADGYAGFNGFYETGSIVEVACWAHVRRRFHDLHHAHASPLAADALRRIGALYAIEAELRGRSAETRKNERQARAGPLLTAFWAWLQTTLSQVSQKSVLAEAIRYALTSWTALTRYRDDGRLEIDNNVAERSLRPVALGRKNFLFAGSDAGGERAAALYTLIGTAKLNGLDPEAYLRAVLSQLAEYPVNRVDQLLPWKLAASPAPDVPQIPALAGARRCSRTKYADVHPLVPVRPERQHGAWVALTGEL